MLVPGWFRGLGMVGAALAMAVGGRPASRADDAERPPNVVIILADDLGYGDVGFNNPEAGVVTPRLDEVASESLRFTNAYAPGAVCVPTRFGLLTGCYPWRIDRRWTAEPMIDADRPTLPGLLKRAGHTTAMVGKWHLGFEGGKDFEGEPPYRGGPLDRGFDFYFGIPASLDIPPYFYLQGRQPTEPPTESIGDHDSGEPWTRIQGAFWRAGAIAPDLQHKNVLPRLTEEAIRFLERHQADQPDQPFFLYLALTAPHTPWLPGARFEGRGEAGLYSEFVAMVDAEIGRVLDTIDRLDQRAETLVIFTSDNGPVWYPKDIDRTGHRASGPLRGMKGDAWEGGHRMPFLVRWPGHVPAGETCGALLCFTDLMATLAALTHQPLPDAGAEDSLNLLPLWLGEAPEPAIRDTVVTQSSAGVLSIRQGRWKLIPRLGSGGFSEPRNIKPTPGGPTGQLYDLESDLGEQRNRYAEHPEIVERLSRQFAELRRRGRSRPGDSG